MSFKCQISKGFLLVLLPPLYIHWKWSRKQLVTSVHHFCGVQRATWPPGATSAAFTLRFPCWQQPSFPSVFGALILHIVLPHTQSQDLNSNPEDEVSSLQAQPCLKCSMYVGLRRAQRPRRSGHVFFSLKDTIRSNDRVPRLPMSQGRWWIR